MSRGFRTRKHSDDWRGLRGRGVNGGSRWGELPHTSETTPTPITAIHQEGSVKTLEFSRFEVRPLQPYLGELQQQHAEFVRLAGTIREPRQSIFQKVRGTIIRLLLAAMLVDLIRTIPENKNRILRPPGSSLGSIAEFIFSKKTVELVVTPIISDLQVEYCEALAEDRKNKARWVRLRGYWSLFKALGLYSVVKMFFEMWRKLSSS
jgi:hypothetical protein